MTEKTQVFTMVVGEQTVALDVLDLLEVVDKSGPVQATMSTAAGKYGVAVTISTEGAFTGDPVAIVTTNRGTFCLRFDQ